MKWYHKRSFMVPFKFILIVQNNSEIFKSIPYRYKFPVGARDLFSSLEAVSSIPNNLSTFPLVTCNFPNLKKRLIELFPPVK
ncbi:hypothetical protein FORC39_p007 (plasmid) [Staphylococcus aureus]|nr:hypothetical protein FORC39_p007 [Staphylococcus aureus]